MITFLFQNLITLLSLNMQDTFRHLTLYAKK